jgi:hypothetical protein
VEVGIKAYADLNVRCAEVNRYPSTGTQSERAVGLASLLAKLILTVLNTISPPCLLSSATSSDEHPLRKPFRHLNIYSDRDRKSYSLHAGTIIHIRPEPLFTSSESLFTSIGIRIRDRRSGFDRGAGFVFSKEIDRAMVGDFEQPRLQGPAIIELVELPVGLRTKSLSRCLRRP